VYKKRREGYFAFIPIMANSRGALNFLTNPDHGTDEDFFLTENSKSIGFLSLRKEFNKARDWFVVFLQNCLGMTVIRAVIFISLMMSLVKFHSS
jgi:hypothetical protein